MADLYNDCKTVVCVYMCLLQSLSPREARGVIVGYRVVSNVRRFNAAGCPHSNINVTNTTKLIPNTLLSHTLNFSKCASYVVTVNAQTEVGINETLTLNDIVIPSRHEGLLQDCHSTVVY